VRVTAAGSSVFLPGTAVLFDLDGVLVDSDADVVTAWSAWATGYRLAPERVLDVVHGRRTADTVAEFFAPGPDAAAALDRINELELTGVRAAVAVPGAAELVRSIDVDRWGVVTSGRRELAQARLDAAGLWPVPALVAAEDVRAGKPAPDGYVRAAREIGAAMGSVLVLEDADAGVRAARAAGASGIVGIGHRAAETDADVVVVDLRALSWTGDGLRIDAAGMIRP
jgi:sugar-phosphatase